MVQVKFNVFDSKIMQQLLTIDLKGEVYNIFGKDIFSQPILLFIDYYKYSIHGFISQKGKHWASQAQNKFISLSRSTYSKSLDCSYISRLSKRLYSQCVGPSLTRYMGKFI